MKKHVLISTQMMIHDQQRFRNWLQAEGITADFIMNDQFLSECECLELPAIYDGWISGDDEITKNVIDHLIPKLKIISKWGSGIDTIDKAYAIRSGVKITNSPGAFSDAVGELAVGYLLSLTRGIIETHQSVISGGWPKKTYKTLVGMDVGFVGMGAIGQGAAKRLKGFGCKISYSDPIISNLKYQKKELEALFSQSEAIIITSDLNPSTYHLVNSNLLNKCKKNTFIINVSRGQIINETDLISSLNNGQVGGVALDVFEKEPINLENEILKMPNVILGSHNANNTLDAVEKVHELTIRNLIKSLDN